jgi:116 kDa U5 small nuclear ribonucleoprotein component
MWQLLKLCNVRVQVRVLGETYTPEDEEDSTVAEVSNVWVYQARYRVALPKATAGAYHITSC